MESFSREVSAANQRLHAAFCLHSVLEPGDSLSAYHRSATGESNRRSLDRSSAGGDELEPIPTKPLVSKKFLRAELDWR